MTELALTKPRILPPKGLLIALAAQLPILISCTPLRPSGLEIAAGGIFIIIGVVLNVWAERLFRQRGLGVCPFTHVPGLVGGCPYRWPRDPMYLGLVCLNSGVTLLSGVPANLWSSIAFCIWLHYAFVLPEESFLRHELGDAFHKYAERVPRWFLR